MRTAVVHDWLTGMRGGELVLEEILDLVPDPTIFTLFHFRGAVSAAIEARPIRTTFLQRFVRPSNYRHFLPLFPAAVERMNFSGFDAVVSSSHCVAKGARPPKGVRHLCYCHTPVRYAYDQFDMYFPRGRTRLRAAKRLTIAGLRAWDVATVGRVDRFLANSTRVAQRIASAYRRPSTVVFPPVDVDFFTPGREAPSDYALAVGALVPYKAFDRAVAWANSTGRRLILVGTGPEQNRLRQLAGSSVSFEMGLSREELRERYRRCAFYVQPGEEDFGIASVEAQACGRPVVALARGGVRDIVTSPRQGVLYAEDSAEALASAIDTLPGVGFNPEAARVAAERFSRERFRSAWTSAWNETMNA
jgi:glycosyltransferase involved in cell wall biosynthesis